jgi:hypothetical protein
MTVMMVQGQAGISGMGIIGRAAAAEAPTTTELVA